MVRLGGHRSVGHAKLSVWTSAARVGVHVLCTVASSLKVRVCVCVHVHVCVYMCVCVYVYVYMCVCVTTISSRTQSNIQMDDQIQEDVTKWPTKIENFFFSLCRAFLP